jgi:cysteine synthase A
VAQADARLVEDAIADPQAPIVMFALEWCEFCWSIRRLFARLGIAFRSIDLDSSALHRENLGARMRAALTSRTGIATIPQVFVGGQLIGGATDVIDAIRTGQFQSQLRTLGIPFDARTDVDPRSFLPAWIHPRRP